MLIDVMNCFVDVDFISGIIVVWYVVDCDYGKVRFMY